jgi:desulfoferrodoxin (superoxide reductase-like protein)
VKRKGLPVRRPFLTSRITIALLAAVSGVWAHPASAVRLEFDPVSRVLTVTVAHDTKKPAEHYIQSVSVRLNGKEIVRQEFASQENGSFQTVSYKIIDAKPGDAIEVTTICNVFGKKKESIRL